MSSSSPEQIEQDLEQTRQELCDNVEALKEKVSPASAAQRGAARISETVSEARDRVMGVAEDKADTLVGGASRVEDRAQQAAGDAADRIQRTAQEARGRAQAQMRGNPLAVGLAAFAIGWLIGSLLPVSDKERQAGQALRESEAVRSAAQPLQESAKDLAAQTMDQAKDAATSVGQEAKEAASAIADEVKSGAQDVNAEAKRAMDQGGQPASPTFG